MIAACLDLANLMERGGTCFKTMIDSYRDADEDKQPGVLIYPGFLDLRLYDRLYQKEVRIDTLSGEEIVLELLKDGPKPVKELQNAARYRSRSKFLADVINPLIDTGRIERVGKAKSPTSKIRLRQFLLPSSAAAAYSFMSAENTRGERRRSRRDAPLRTENE